ncbi:AAA family ATPase [Solirubrobacter phytolaccae]|uniref:Nuclease SbcCD subunit C n=1 Tax=Solirubrobacter phytolaccae TaxID=1404360 RepID=A0A9X3NDZ7_9ACTN|nr:AAA family ATPase [Solirubrobacter phytolaccae]MDA0183172.1 AAA family ATPase [Solirubrobacter phytolaccae]
MSVQFTSIQLEGFRGFTRAQSLDLDADVVLVRGNNGSGKTSLVDGFLWLLSGDLEYLDQRVKGMRKDHDPVVSRYAGGEARVVIELTADDEPYVFTRSGRHRASTLTAVRNGRQQPGAERILAEVFGHTDAEALAVSVNTWGILRQDAVRATLDAGAAMHDRIAAIVGLERVTAFSSATKQAARDLLTRRTASNRAFEALKHRRQEAVERARVARAEVPATSGDDAVRASLDRLSRKLPRGFVYDVPTATDVTAFGRALRNVSEALVVLRDLRVKGTRAPAVDAAGIESIEREVTEARERLDEATRRGPAAIRLAEAALSLLADDTCPVCGQSVDRTTLADRLRETVAMSSELVSAVQEANDALASSSSRLSAARLGLEEAQRIAHETATARAALREAVAAESGMRLAEVPDDPDELQSAVDGFERTLGESRILWRELRQASAAAHLERLDAEANALETELAAMTTELSALDRSYESAKALDDSAHAAAERIIAGALAKLQPSFAEVFDRLNPNPAFTELRSRQDVFRKANQVKPVVYDPIRELEANPLLVFSEGQVNVVALSYFLGMALNAHDAMLPFLILDDPLQSLDTVAVLGFGDLFRRLRGRRQLIVTTHDRRYADILARKLAPREPGDKTIVHDFEGWTREGPKVKSSEPALAEIIPLVKRHAA